MKTDLELNLYNKYPQLCKNFRNPKSCFAYGFECHDGWYSLIDKTFFKINELQKNFSVYIEQVKSKFGGLRIYIEIEDCKSTPENQQAISQIYSIIHDAEVESFKISELSGLPAKTYTINGWLWTLTSEEAKEISNKRNEI